MTVMEQVRHVPGLDVENVVLPVDFSPLSWRILPLAEHIAFGFRFEEFLEPAHER